jgi:hypothetical protein
MRQRLLRPAAERTSLDPAGHERPKPPQIELVAGERMTTPSVESSLRERFDDGFLFKAGLAMLGLVGVLVAISLGGRLLGL